MDRLSPFVDLGELTIDIHMDWQTYHITGYGICLSANVVYHYSQFDSVARFTNITGTEPVLSVSNQRKYQWNMTRDGRTCTEWAHKHVPFYHWRSGYRISHSDPFSLPLLNSMSSFVLKWRTDKSVDCWYNRVSLRIEWTHYKRTL